MRSKKARTLVILSLVVTSLGFSLGLGSVPWQAPSFNTLIFLDLRLPRTLAAFLTGGCLSLAGCLMQLLLDNPLADPYVLGLSSGACVGTLVAVCLTHDLSNRFTGAWLGALGSILLLLMLAKRHRFHTPHLLLTGVTLASLLAALASVLALTLHPNAVSPLLLWLTGDLSSASLTPLPVIVLTSTLLFCLFFARGYDILSRGTLEARLLGLNVTGYRLSLFFLSALLTATAVTLAGCIGFIGLIIPHLARGLVGQEHRWLLPASVLMGGSLLTLADTCSRTLFAPIQLPIGLATTLLGVPFLWRMLRP